jgi:hypothetical protein
MLVAVCKTIFELREHNQKKIKNNEKTNTTNRDMSII